MIIERSFSQNTPEWDNARLWSVGGTGISNIITSTGQLSKSRENYLIEKASQRLAGYCKPVYPSYEMKWGTDHEQEARDIFSFIHDVEVDTCAMIFADENRNWHISPDGLLENSGIEIKCPMLKTHLKYLECGALPTEYRLQVQSSLALTGFDRWWFMSYFPKVEPLIIHVERDEKLIQIIKDEVSRFNEELDAFINKIAA